jgi:hypothetical protein
VSDPEAEGAGSARLGTARARVAKARAAADEARRAAEPAYAARARRRRGRAIVATGCAIAIAVVLAAVAIVFGVQHRGAEQDRTRDADVLADTRSAVTTLLTIDPADPAGFVDRALVVTTGEQHRRLEQAQPQLLDLAGQLGVPSTGQVLAAGITGEVEGSTARVFVVAEGTDPTLLGGNTAQNRVALVVTMKDVDGQWKIDRTEVR